MDEYPNPEEEYEIMHLEEMEAMADMEREMLLSRPGLKKCKTSLNFDEISPDSNNKHVTVSSKKGFLGSEGNDDNIAGQLSKKRNLSCGSLIDMISDSEIFEPAAKKPKCNSSLNDSVVTENEKEYGTTSFNVPKWPFVKISTSNGERLYVKLRQNETITNDYEFSKIIKNRRKSNLLETSYCKLKAVVEESVKKKLIQNEEDSTLREQMKEKAELWVEQFKPKTYFDLLSEEAVNRTLLQWLKMWDKIVFNKEPKCKVLNNSKLPVKENDLKLNQAKVLDPDGRPHFKVALLCGPPGLGKTTLAHIAAVKAGYNIVEVNASDDRSIDALSAKLDNATQMQAVMGNCKPTCIILDEIDGAPTQTIEFLLKYINGKCPEKGKKETKENRAKVVKRPIVCICNELYTPSLRSLRQQAFLIHFPNTSSAKLVPRLMEICKKQNIKTDLTALTLLCEKTQNDIRSCISTLHFFKNKSDQPFGTADVLKTDVGLKDFQTSTFNIWKEIFQDTSEQPGSYSSVVNKTKENENPSNMSYRDNALERMQNMVRNCMASGDYDRLVEGVYENFLRSRFYGGMVPVAEGLEWFCWYDLLDRTIKKTQNYALMAYLPYSFGMWQMLFSSSSFYKINYPSTGYENRLKEAKCDQILNDVFRGLNPNLRVFNQKQSLLFDTVPLIDVIMKPTLRPVNPTLFNEREKKDFKHLIDVMVDFNLNYVQQKSVDGSYSYLFDPNIDELFKFSGADASSSRTYSYNLKQLISHELELEKMRRSEGGDPSSENEAKAGVASKSELYKPAVLKPKGIDIKETGHYKDFFGRIVSREETSSEKGIASKNNPIKSPIWYCFKEGYNNAVKKDVTIRDLI